MVQQFKRPPKRVVNGIVLLNKPVGDSSNGILQKVIRAFNAKKGGHTGALDPFATGLLPICLGEATKVSGLLLESDKRYTATLKLGEQSDTGDTEGEIIKTLPVPELSQNLIESVLAKFMGDIQQIPPMYSALKHQGKPLYFYARQGIEIERPARPIKILNLSLVSFTDNQIIFDVHCSKGTYVRTLGEDIAKALGTVGHLTALHRTQTGSLMGEDMLTLEEIEQQLDACVQPLDIAIQHLQRIDLTTEQADLIRHGGKLEFDKPETDFVRFYENDICIAVGEWQAEKQLLKPKRVFNLPESVAG
ncbi:tRNA pseudouridine(55) synthase TruB [Thiomicrorhabdus sp.]|uniref:tRNA pseudouridine(55) synthase TruB n=1 Tax=Thiomicrorhabdus sp. TaxID=2039724 RepID=UPI002AA880FD|nr:tRNA pseudouridine(55) synthase TruB [Thiomicrorhabdus sp.]